jgi:hypothetical protein
VHSNERMGTMTTKNTPVADYQQVTRLDLLGRPKRHVLSAHPGRPDRFRPRQSQAVQPVRRISPHPSGATRLPWSRAARRIANACPRR